MLVEFLACVAMFMLPAQDTLQTEVITSAPQDTVTVTVPVDTMSAAVADTTSAATLEEVPVTVSDPEVSVAPESAPVAEPEVVPAVSPEDEVKAILAKEKFWNKRRSLRIGYEMHNFTSGGEAMPVKIGLGLSRNRNVWFHKKPIAGMVKLAFDHGFDFNYSMFDAPIEKEGMDYSDEEEGSQLPFDLSGIGMHNLSIGYALGASVTVNPVAKLRINGYFHFVPSLSMVFSGEAFNAGFMPYCKYGAELSYDWFGLGIEWGSGASTMHDVMALVEGEVSGLLGGSSESEVQKTKCTSTFTRIYVAFRLGKK